MKETEYTEIRRERMRELLRLCRGSQKVLSERLDTDRAYMSTLIGKNPTRSIGADLARRAEKEFDKPIGWMDNLGESEAYMVRSKENLTQLQLITGGKTEQILSDVEVPEYSITASMGPGNGVGDEDISARWPINEKVLLKMGVVPSMAAIIPVEGDSMISKLHDGDLVIVDRTPVTRLTGKVYILWSERAGLQAKQVMTSPDGETISVISANPDKDLYPTQTYQPDDFESTFKVRGTAVKVFLGNI